jgi:raffinose/stachyose/melibiose transport system permease protein
MIVAVVAQAWVWIYADNGPLNEFRDIGLGALARLHGRLHLGLPAVGGIDLVTYGLCMVLFIAGAQSIPSASTTQPASTVPAPCASSPSRCRRPKPGRRRVRPTTINALRSFDIYNTTSGGPGTTTYVPSSTVPKRVRVQSGRLRGRDRCHPHR